MPLPLGAGLTSLEGCTAPELPELLELLELLLEEEDGEESEVELDVEVGEVLAAFWLAVEALPGMVAALTAANTPTAATAAAPTQKVSRLTSLSAASRASIRFGSMGVSLSNATGLEMGTT